MKSQTVVAMYIISTLIFTGFASSASRANSNVLSLGSGLDTAFLGIKYQHWIGNSPFSLGVGAGIEGVASNIQLAVLQIKGLSVSVQAVGFYSPYDSILTGEDTVIIGGGLGLQLWPSTPQGVSLYLNVGGGLGAVLAGETEGGDEENFPYPSLHLGIVF